EVGLPGPFRVLWARLSIAVTLSAAARPLSWREMIAMSDATKLALLAVLTELLAGCPPHVPIGSCAPDASRRAPGPVVAGIGGGAAAPEWGWGMNSPTIGDGVVFDELDSSQAMEDAHGIKIKSALLDDGNPVDLPVTRDRLSASRRSDPSKML